MNKFGILITRRFTSNFAYILGILSLEKKRIKFLARIDFSRARKKNSIRFNCIRISVNEMEPRRKEGDRLSSIIDTRSLNYILLNVSQITNISQISSTFLALNFLSNPLIKRESTRKIRGSRSCKI